MIKPTRTIQMIRLIDQVLNDNSIIVTASAILIKRTKLKP